MVYSLQGNDPTSHSHCWVSLLISPMPPGPRMPVVAPPAAAASPCPSQPPDGVGCPGLVWNIPKDLGVGRSPSRVHCHPHPLQLVSASFRGLAPGPLSIPKPTDAQVPCVAQHVAPEIVSRSLTTLILSLPRGLHTVCRELMSRGRHRFLTEPV